MGHLCTCTTKPQSMRVYATLMSRSRPPVATSIARRGYILRSSLHSSRIAVDASLSPSAPCLSSYLEHMHRGCALDLSLMCFMPGPMVLKRAVRMTLSLQPILAHTIVAPSISLAERIERVRPGCPSLGTMLVGLILPHVRARALPSRPLNRQSAVTSVCRFPSLPYLRVERVGPGRLTVGTMLVGTDLLHVRALSPPLSYHGF